MRNACLAILLSLFLLPIQTVAAKPGKAVEIESKKIDIFLPGRDKQTRFLEVEFLGGLELSSKDESFGGISGIRMLDASRFIAVTDQGKWLTGDVVRDGDKPIGVENTRMGRLEKKSGKKLKGKKNADSEGIEISGDEFLISFERNHRVERFAFKKDALTAQSKKPLFRLDDVGLSNNKGPEGIALAPEGSPVAGAILTFPENAFNEDGNLRSFIVKDGKREEFAIVPSNGFSLTDANFLPNGNLLVLERRYSFFSGLGMRVRMFNGSQIKPGALLAGSILLTANSSYEMDNMEGLAVSEMADGSTRLTIISDDNFSMNQRTILMEYRLIENN